MESIKSIKETIRTLENVTDISDYIEGIILVGDIHIHRALGTTVLNKKMLGIKSDNIGVDNFFKNYTKDGTIYLIPTNKGSVGARLNSLTTNIRQRMSASYFNKERKWMTVDSYLEFREFLLEKREDFFAIRAEIVVNWDIYYNRFIDDLRDAFKNIHVVEAESHIKKILDSMPTKDKFESSFSINFDVYLMPGCDITKIDNQSILDDLKAGETKRVMEYFNGVIGTALNFAFQKIASAYESTGSNKKPGLTAVPGKTLTALDKVPTELRNRKLLKDSGFLLEELAVLFEDITKTLYVESSTITAMDLLMDLASMIYGYSVELDMDELIKFNKGAKTKEDIFFRDELLENFTEVKEKREAS